MSDELVKRASYALHDLQGRVEAGKLAMFSKCIDRIEELEAEIDYFRRWQNAAFWANPNIDIDIDKCPEAQEELKDKTNEQQ